MEFNKFCETVAEKLGVKLIPLPTEYEFAHNHIFPIGHRPTYEEYCKRRGVYKNDKFSVDFVDWSIGKKISYHCEVYNAKTHYLFGYVDDYGDIKSSYYNRDDGMQEVYYDGSSLEEAVDFLKRHSDPVCVW